MATATLRIPQEKRDLLKIIATMERREMKDIVSEFIDDYFARHKGSLELLSRPEWAAEVRQGKREVREAASGKSSREREQRLRDVAARIDAWKKAHRKQTAGMDVVKIIREMRDAR